MSFGYEELSEEVMLDDSEGIEWDTLLVMEGSKVLKNIPWDDTWGDILSVKISRTVDDNGYPSSDWNIEQVLNTFEEEVELPSDVLGVIENYLANERN